MYFCHIRIYLYSNIEVLKTTQSFRLLKFILYLFLSKTAFFTSFCTAHFDIQEITLTFTFQNGGTSREWC